MADKLSIKTILSNFKKAFESKKKRIDLYRQDMEFALGKQWDDADIADNVKIGVKPLTINKIKPNIQLLTGIETQNRVDYRAYPKGEEDGLKADALTGLMKNVMDESEGEHKHSEQFEEGISAGDCYLEPYLDYSHDLINAQLSWKKVSTTRIFPDPKSTEYDLSDSGFICKLTTELSKDDLLNIFPDKEKTIDNLSVTKIDTLEWNNLKASDTGEHIQKGSDYYQPTDNNTIPGASADKEETYDLLEYYYKKRVSKTLLIDTALKKMQMIEDEEKARQYEAIGNQEAPGSVRVVKRYATEIWLASVVGNTILSDERAWYCPKWNKYHIVPFFAYRSTADIKNVEYLVQGIVRGLKDMQLDYNKRRTQELRHLNSSANSGWQIEEGSISETEEDNYKNFGASPGVILKHKQGKPAPLKITPTPLSQGHAQVSAERSQEMKESSGINTDLLAMNESQASGKAIAMRQRQGLVMVQKLFDNDARTRKYMGKFILSQLGEVFDVESATKVMGDKWVLKNFGQPKMKPQQNPMTGAPMIDPQTGQPAMIPELDQSGQLILEMTPEAQQMSMNFFNEVLNDKDVAKYDVSIGEGIYSETIKYANFLMLQEMAQAGLPIPPDVLISESTLSAGTKDRITAVIQSAQAQQPKMPM